MVTGFLVVAQIYAVLPLLGALAVELNITDAEASFIPTAFGLSYAFGFFIFGPVADKVNRMTVLVAGLIALAGATALAAMVTTYETLVIARVLQGIAAASFPATALALVAERMPPKDQPMAISMLGFAFLSSAPLSQFLVGALGMPLDALMWWTASLYVVCAVVVVATAAANVGPAVGLPNSATKAGSNGADTMYPPVAAFIIAPMTVLFCLVSFHALCQFLANLDPTIDPQLLRLVGFPPLFVCFLAPRITMAFGPAITACSGLVVAAFGMVIGGAGLGLVWASIVLSAGVALAVPGLIAAVTFWSGGQVRARALATYTFFLFIGASVAPVIASATYHVSTMIGFGAPAIAALIACGLLYHSRPKPINQSINRKDPPDVADTQSQY